uniref:Uncharacterized protein n=1 Tax=Panagrolaimus davidi TaxID=227884 RepID=A0A914PJ48_9BILA
MKYYFPFTVVTLLADSTPIRLENTEQLIQIGDREPYEAKLTSITFSKPICIIALEIHTLQPLTGAEDIEITYNLCEESSTSNITWTLAHYTNKKNVFVLRHPILAKKLAVVAGFERNRNLGAAAMAILDVDIKQCNINTVFGSVESEKERKCQKSTSPSQHHRHRSHSAVLKVSDAELDQLLLGHISSHSQTPNKQHQRKNDSIEAVFIRTKRQTTEKVTSFHS